MTIKQLLGLIAALIISLILVEIARRTDKGE
jgi:hypothetical protein